MPLDTIYVGRPTKWGNPYQLPVPCTEEFREKQILKYEQSLSEMFKCEIRKELHGKNLACFCSLNKKCHADILLKIANIHENK